MKALRELLTQLEQSQWRRAQALQAMQLERFSQLAQHAWRHSPFYRLRFERAGWDGQQMWTPERYARIPLLTRSELMLQLDHLCCHVVPPEQGACYMVQTSGSTGQTVTVLRTDATQLYWLAFTMRDHLWQRRDFSATLAVIRATSPVLDDPVQAARLGWGPPASLLTPTGPSFSQPLSMPVALQAAWLERIHPQYLLTYPTNLAALLDLHERGEVRLPASLREVRAIGETLHAGLRQRCAALGLAVVDMYSSQELGIIALQCPQSGLYHTQDENLIVEVLDEQGNPCAPGQIGRIVITDLSNYATPLIRYEIRDYAEAGPPCACGRGLSTLRRILGRRRNMVTLPDGSKHWPLVGAHHYREIADILQYQVVQHSLTEVEVRLVAPRPLAATQESKIAALVHTALGHAFPLRFSYFTDELPGTRGGKFEEFISLLD